MKYSFENISADRRKLEQEYCRAFLFIDQFDIHSIDGQQQECIAFLFDPLP